MSLKYFAQRYPLDVVDGFPKPGTSTRNASDPLGKTAKLRLESLPSLLILQ
jgi:hypothetical protein